MQVGDLVTDAMCSGTSLGIVIDIDCGLIVVSWLTHGVFDDHHSQHIPVGELKKYQKNT